MNTENVLNELRQVFEDATKGSDLLNIAKRLSIANTKLDAIAEANDDNELRNLVCAIDEVRKQMGTDEQMIYHYINVLHSALNNDKESYLKHFDNYKVRKIITSNGLK